MLYYTRKSNSCRTSKPIEFEIENYNTAGQGGTNEIVFMSRDGPDRVYHILSLDSDEEARELLSAVAKARAHTKPLVVVRPKNEEIDID